MNNETFRELLDLLMCCDPAPGGCSVARLEQFANDHSRLLGFDTWVDAYHMMELPGVQRTVSEK